MSYWKNHGGAIFHHALAATHFVMVVLGYGVMRLVARPAPGSLLARRPWETAASAAASD